MWSKLAFLFDFIKDLTFKDQDELNLKSRKFNTRKLAFYLFMIASLSLNAFLFDRVLYLVERVQHLEKQYYYTLPWNPLPPTIPYRSP